MNPLVDCVVVGPLETNCYIIRDESTRSVVLVDPGAPDERLQSAVNGWQVAGVLLTHAHFDHIGGLAWAAKQCQGAIRQHQAEAGWPRDPLRNLSVFMPDDTEQISVSAPTATFTGDTVIQLLGMELTAWHTPGHSPGHMVYRVGDTIFTGDLVFQGGVGRTDLPGGNHATLQHSIERVILPLPGHIRLLPGHGAATDVASERDLLEQICRKG